jgi:hypothetical protein
MDRRELLGVIGAGAGVAVLGQARAADDADRFRYRTRLDKTHLDCLKACEACAATCNEGSQHCLDQLKEHAEHGHGAHHAQMHRRMMDCQAVCLLVAGMVARQSPFLDIMANACGDTCKRCGDECEKDKSSDEMMKECIRMCRECERTCRDMARAVTAA